MLSAAAGASAMRGDGGRGVATPCASSGCRTQTERAPWLLEGRCPTAQLPATSGPRVGQVTAVWGAQRRPRGFLGTSHRLTHPESRGQRARESTRLTGFPESEAPRDPPRAPGSDTPAAVPGRAFSTGWDWRGPAPPNASSPGRLAPRGAVTLTWAAAPSDAHATDPLPKATVETMSDSPAKSRR